MSLAVFRGAVGGVWLLLPDLEGAVRWAGLPAEVRVAPVGLGWLIEHVPISVEHARVAQLVLIAALIAGTLGIATRLSWAIVTVVGLYVLAIPQLAGSVFHYHHLVWFAALLAASPSGDAISVDAWLARRRGVALPERSVAYGLPIRIAWVLIGLIFLFPGTWKLITSGSEWILSDNLRNHMWAKWAQMPGFTPIARVDRIPWLVRLGALFVVALELSFLPLVLFRRTRLLAALAALLFHQLTAHLMGLRFPALWLCYVVFVDWERVGRWLEGEAPPHDPVPARSARTVRVTAVVGAVLIAGATAFGALGISEGWPFACYPKFDRIARERLPTLEVELAYPDGRTWIVPVEHLSPDGRSQRWWALSWSLMGSHETARASPERFESFFERVASRGPLRERARGAVEVRFNRVYVSTDPDARDRPPLSRERLYVLPLES